MYEIPTQGDVLQTAFLKSHRPVSGLNFSNNTLVPQVRVNIKENKQHTILSY